MIGLFSVLYVDDGAFPFGNIVQLEQGVELVYSHFTNFGLDVHIGREGKPSKTELVFFPPPWLLHVTSDTTMQELGVETVPSRQPGSLSTSQHQANFGDQHDKGERHEDKEHIH